VICTRCQVELELSFEDEVGGECSKNGAEEKCIKVIGEKTRRKETTRKTKM
jgi:hypothetical protein